MYGFMDVCEYVWIFFMEYLLCGSSSSIGWLLWKYSDWGITGSTTHGYCSVVVVVVKVMVMVMVMVIVVAVVIVVVGETAIVIIVAVVVVVVSYT